MVLAVALAIAPPLFWLWSVLRHDDHEREPWGLVTLAVLLGACSPLGVLWLRPLLEHCFEPVSLWLDAFVVTACHEELWKLLALLPLLLLREVDEPLDGGVYGAAVGLGFAACENVFFVHANADAVLALQRGFTATLLHATCSGCLGIALATAKLRRPRGPASWLWPVLGFASVVLLHGCYDLYLTGERPQVWVSLLGVLPAALVLWTVKLRWARRRSPEFHP